MLTSYEPQIYARASRILILSTYILTQVKLKKKDTVHLKQKSRPPPFFRPLNCFARTDHH